MAIFHIGCQSGGGEMNTTDSPKVTTSGNIKVDQRKSIKQIVTIVAVLAGLVGSYILIDTGFNMQAINSVVSSSNLKTLDELFYNAVGLGFVGLGIVCASLTIILALRK
jgi:hydrogenase maturation factor